MKTLILNGSPKGKNGNSEIFAAQFNKGMTQPCEIRYIVKEDAKQLALYMENFDAIIIVMPLYVHAMPGIVMKLIECMTPAQNRKQAIGFIIQAGFFETAQEQYVKRYFKALANRLNYSYLGTVAKGNSAGVYMMPKFYKKLFKQIENLGRHYEKTGAFDSSIVKQFEYPYSLTKNKSRWFEFLNRIGVSNIFWHKFLKDNGAFNKKLDRPFM